MLKTWTFWKTFFTAYIALVAGIWGFVEAYTYFEGDFLKQLLGSSWWIFYYLLPLFIAFSVATLTNAKQESQAETLNQRNRRVMLNHVENFWVKGILEKSLHGAALLELGIKEDLSAVSYPWTIKKESTNETLPADKSILEVFEEIGLGRSLLILGAPGSGKTTTLLELTRQLIERANREEIEPIPVVFNLASWNENQTLAEWLAEQLNILYNVPKRATPSWINENRMFLLLDGFDEVKKESRIHCLEAINQFRKTHGMTSVVVCSRSREYSEIDTKLLLSGAIIIQPLTSNQIDAYFDRFGKSLFAVKELLKKDEALQELAETPLMLSIMALAYRDRKTDELIASGNIEEQRKKLFDTYITRMFERSTRSTKAPFSKERMAYYLTQLARKMIQQNIINYQIEDMQPNWFERNDHRIIYSLFLKVSSALILALAVGIYTWINTETGSKFLSGFGFGPLTSGLVGGLLGMLMGLVLTSTDKIVMMDQLKWSWDVNTILTALIFTLPVGLVLGMALGWVIVPVFWLVSGVMGGMLSRSINTQIEETNYPGQRLRQTLFNAILITLLISPIFGLAHGVSSGLNSWLSVGIFPRLIIGVLGGFLFGFATCGIALLQHYLLRFMLARYYLIPRLLSPFLEHAVDLIFLRRVGGSYIFVHRLLMEHFAEIDA